MHFEMHGGTDIVSCAWMKGRPKSVAAKTALADLKFHMSSQRLRFEPALENRPSVFQEFEYEQLIVTICQFHTPRESFEGVEGVADEGNMEAAIKTHLRRGPPIFVANFSSLC
jgi:hypothetical protein